MAGFKTPRQYTRNDSTAVQASTIEQDLYQISLATDIVDARAFGGLDDVTIGPSKEQMITTAIQYAAATGKSKVFIPASMFGYNASLVTFNSAVQLIREGSLDGNIVDARAYGAIGDGVTDDAPAITAAIASLGTIGGTVLLPHTAFSYLCKSTIVLPFNVKLTGEGPTRTTIKKGFNGTLITVTGASHTEISEMALDGMDPTFTGKAIVYSGVSLRPVIRNLWTINFTVTHVEFGADAGQLAVVRDWQARVGSTSEYEALRISGPDTTGAFRQFSGCQWGLGYGTLVGAQDTQFTGCTFKRIESDAATGILEISSCTMANLGATITFNGNTTVIMGCRISGSVVLSATFQGAFIANELTSTLYTLTDNSTGPSNAFVLHRPITNVAMILGRQRLISKQAGATVGTIVTESTLAMGNASNVFLPLSGPATALYSTALTGPRTHTLSTVGAVDGMTHSVVRSGGGTNTLDVGPGLYLFPSSGNGFVDLVYDGVAAAWTVRGSGQIHPLIGSDIGIGGTFTQNRFQGSGTAHVAGDYALSAGWGATATVSAIAARDTGGRVTINSAGAGQAGSPTVVLTFKDGTWGGGILPAVVSARGDTSAPTTGFWALTGISATQASWTFIGLPVAGNNYVLDFITMGK